MNAYLIRIRGIVQGVGFRPTIWRLAAEYGMTGDVRNDGDGVAIRVWAAEKHVSEFCRGIVQRCPPLARIDSLEQLSFDPLVQFPGLSKPTDFKIIPSDIGNINTSVVADAAICAKCRAEVLDPTNRRYRYAFTNCTHCGPRLSIVSKIPYDRDNTAMSAFDMCDACRAEYNNPYDRRFHAQPNACSDCGPQVWLVNASGSRVEPEEFDTVDAIAAASYLLKQGAILAVKGIGGFHLMCDAHNEQSVIRLRIRKHRQSKPLALMAPNLDVIQRYCSPDGTEIKSLQSSAAPIVLLPITGPKYVAQNVAPGQSALGFILPYSPLHVLLSDDWDRPLVMTSGNATNQTQCTDNQDAMFRLHGIADYFLLHDRNIVNRVDDSVVKSMDKMPRILRRARGFSPEAIVLPLGMKTCSSVLALGGQQKNTICLAHNNHAVISQHLGDLAYASTCKEFEQVMDYYLNLYQIRVNTLAVDCHPDYYSNRFAYAWAQEHSTHVTQVQHHHAHIASVLVDNHWPTNAGKVIGVALDGMGYGEKGEIWGGEFLLANYHEYERIAHFKTIPMPGGSKAVLEPWRNTYAHIVNYFGWNSFRENFADLELTNYLQTKPLHQLEAMLNNNLNSPLTSSCGRLFDAVAAALGICRDCVSYEGQAAIELEALAMPCLSEVGIGYFFDINTDYFPAVLSAEPMWLHLFSDLKNEINKSLIAARFQIGLADGVAELVRLLSVQYAINNVALSGGVFQNRIILERLLSRLNEYDLTALTHHQVPANDGGLSLGQAAIAVVTSNL